MATSLPSLEFIPCDDSRLNKKSAPIAHVDIKSAPIQNLINKMLVLSGYEADPEKYDSSGVLVGLAAPQVGVMKQIIIVNTLSGKEIANGTLPKFDVLINPKIIWQSDQEEISREGCFSVPEKYLGLPKRPVAIKVEAYNQNGVKFTKQYEGSAAFVVHHEIDHLLGVRFPERLNSEKEMHILEKGSDIPKYRKKWKNWQKHVSKKEWLQMKRGDYKDQV